MIIILEGQHCLYSIFQDLHSRNIIHRDIKPSNIVFSKEGEIRLIDFGLAKKFYDNEHIPFTEDKGMIGTVRYASVNALLGKEQSRRDDLEALFYTLVDLSEFQLPWQQLRCENKSEKIKIVAQQKITFCWDHLPKEFVEFYNSVKQLSFTQKPNYKYLKELFATKIEKQNIQEKSSTYGKFLNQQKFVSPTTNHFEKESSSSGSDLIGEDGEIDIKSLQKQIVSQVQKPQDT